MNNIELMLFVFDKPEHMISGGPIMTITIETFFVPDVGDIVELEAVGYAVQRRTFCFNGEDHDPQWSCALEVIPVH